MKLIYLYIYFCRFMVFWRFYHFLRQLYYNQKTIFKTF